MQSGVLVLLDEMGGDEDDAQVIYSSISMWKSILEGKDPGQIRARNKDIEFAARQPKIVTSNCMHLCDWMDSMFPNAPQNHKYAIPPRIAECEPITGSLYSGSTTGKHSSSFFPAQRTKQEVATAIQDLFA